MWFLILIGGLLSLALLNGGGHGLGRAICGILCAFSGLLSFIFLQSLGNGSHYHPGVGWVILLSVLLTIGFGAAAMSHDSKKG